MPYREKSAKQFDAITHKIFIVVFPPTAEITAHRLLSKSQAAKNLTKLGWVVKIWHLLNLWLNSAKGSINQILCLKLLFKKSLRVCWRWINQQLVAEGVLCRWQVNEFWQVEWCKDNGLSCPLTVKQKLIKVKTLGKHPNKTGLKLL